MARTKGGTLYWYYAKNTGKLSARIKASDSGGWSGYTAIDLSGDSKGDVLARDTSGNLYLYKGNGLGTKFAAKVTVSYGYNMSKQLAAPGDLDGKGELKASPWPASWRPDVGIAPTLSDAELLTRAVVPALLSRLRAALAAPRRPRHPRLLRREGRRTRDAARHARHRTDTGPPTPPRRSSATKLLRPQVRARPRRT